MAKTRICLCELGADLQDTVNWGRKWIVDFNAGKSQLVLFDQSHNTGAIDVKTDGSVLDGSVFYLLSLLCISINLPYKLAWNTVIMSGLVLQAATWHC